MATKRAAGEIKSGKNAWLGKICSSDMRILCEDFIRLQQQRHKADYDVTLTLRKQDAVEAYQRAERILAKIGSVDKDEVDAFLLSAVGIKCPARD